MAVVVTITDGSTTLTLSSITAYGIRDEGFDMSMPPNEVVWGGSPRIDGALPTAQHFGNREMTVTTLINGASPNVVLDNFGALRAMVNASNRYFISGGSQGKPATLSITTNGGTHATQYTVYKGDFDARTWYGYPFFNTTTPMLRDTLARLTCSPLGEEDADVVSTNNNVANDGPRITITAVGGEDMTPVKLSLAADQGYSAGIRIIAARRSGPGDPANWINQMQAEAGVATGYTATNLATITYANTVDATASAGHYGKWTNNSGNANLATAIVREAITSNFPDNMGRFMVYARYKTGGGGGSLSTYLAFGEQNSPTRQTVPVTLPTCAVWHVEPLGIIEWPDYQVPRGATVGTLVYELNTTFNGLNQELHVDDFLLFPIDEEFVEFTHVANTTAGDILVIDRRGFPSGFYLTDSSGNVKKLPAFTPSGAFRNLVPGKNVLVFYVGPKDSGVADALTDTSDIIITHRPRRGFLRGT